MRVCLTTCLVVALVCLAAGGARAQDGAEVAAEEGRGVALGAEVDLRSRYLWRGLPSTDSPVLQPSAWVSAFGCSLSVFGSLLLPNGTVDAEFNEVDAGLECSFDVWVLTLEPSAWLYTYPGTDGPTTGELGLGIILPIRWFRVFTTHYVDVGSYEGAYSGEAGVGAELEADSFGLDAKVLAGWGTARFNAAYAGVDAGALDHVSAQVAVSVDLTDALYIRPHATVAVLVPDELNEAYDERTFFDFGFAVGGEL